MELSIVLKLRKERRDMLEDAFWAVSDPRSAKYGQHLGIAEIKSLLAVPDAQVERVRQYFLGMGALEATPSPFNDVLTLHMTASAAERALHTSIGQFDHRERTEASILR